MSRDHRESRHTHSRPPGTLPRARRPNVSPREDRRSSGDKGRYKSGRQVAPDNRLERPRAGSRSPIGEGAVPAVQTPELVSGRPARHDTARPRQQTGDEELRRWCREAAAKETRSSRYSWAAGRCKQGKFCRGMDCVNCKLKP